MGSLFGVLPSLQTRHSSPLGPHSGLGQETRVGHSHTSNFPPSTRRIWYRVRTLPPHVWILPISFVFRGDTEAEMTCAPRPASPPPSPVPPSPAVLAPGPAWEGVVLPAGAERVRREKPPCSNESAHSAAARRMITRRAGAGGRGPEPRAACAAAPRARSPRLSGC